MTPKEIINNPEFTGLTAHELRSLAHQTKEKFDSLKIQTQERAMELENSRPALKTSGEEIKKDREITRQINELWMTCNNKESEYRSLKKLHIFRTLMELTRFNKDEVFEIVDMIGSCNEYQTGLFKSYVKDACERHYSQSIILEKTKPFDRLLECCDYLSTTHLRSMIMSRSVRVIEHFKKSGEQIDFDSDDRTDLIVTFFFGLNQEYDDLINEGYPVCVNLLTKDRAEIHLGFFSQKGLDYYNMHLAEFINPLLSKKIYTWEEAINIIHQIECVCKEQNDE